MNISFTKAYAVGAQTFATLEEAQGAALDALFAKHPTDPASTTVLKYSDEVIDILTTKASSRPAARKVNGGVKKRKTKPTTNAQSNLLEVTPTPQE